MITMSVRSRSLLAADRLDANYFCSPGTQAAERLAALEMSGVPPRTYYPEIARSD